MSSTRKRRLADRAFDRFSRLALQWENDRGATFMTVHRRPRRAAEIGTWPEPGIRPPRATVVMQGPVYTDHDFTIETLRLYKRSMPGARLILSTWSDTDVAILTPIRELGVTVVLSEKPDYVGPFNVNMQITTAAAGVRRAVDDGTDWILKTRTDQRLYAPDALAFLVALVHAFPLAGGSPQKHRVVGVGLGSLRFAPYHLTDQSLFGAAEDMLTYWTPPLRDRVADGGMTTDSATLFHGMKIGEMCRRVSPEAYLTSHFLTRMGRSLDWTLEDTWAAYRDHFCIADFDTTDFYWVKGQIYSQRERPTVYAMLSNRAEMGFRDWLLLYSGTCLPAAARRYESVLSDHFNAPVPSP